MVGSGGGGPEKPNDAPAMTSAASSSEQRMVLIPAAHGPFGVKGPLAIPESFPDKIRRSLFPCIPLCVLTLYHKVTAMNAYRWIQYFTTRSTRPSGSTLDWTLPAPDAAREDIILLARSLAIFQLGESGGGSRLLAYARRFASRDGRYAGYEKAVQLFVFEEQAHAELLKKIVMRLGGTLLRKQWTNTVFRSVRSLVNLEFNIQVLLSAELIARAYYGLLSRHAPDPVIRGACLDITRDEAGHIAFHTDFFRDRLGAWPAWRARLWRWQFRLLFAATRRVVWMDHGKALRACGITKEMFLSKSRRACQAFLGGTGVRCADAESKRGAEPEQEIAEGAEFGNLSSHAHSRDRSPGG